MSILVSLWIIACGLLQFVVASTLTEADTDRMYSLWLGTVWAGWSASVWISTAIQRPLYRLLLLFASWLWHATLLSGHSHEPLLRYALLLGAYGIVQSIGMLLCKVPSWQAGPLRLSLAPTTRQFTILDLLLLMTALAALIAGIKRYSPPGGGGFWIGLPVVFLMLLILWAFIVGSVNAKSRTVRVVLALLVSICVAAGAFATAEVESRLNFRPIAQSLPLHMMLYISFAGWTMLLATIGQLEAKLFRTPKPPL